MGRKRLDRKVVTYSISKETVKRIDELRQEKQERVRMRPTRVTISEILDEAMAYLINASFGTHAATAALEVRFKKPVRLNQKLLIEAEMLNADHRIRYAQAIIKSEDGTVVALGKGKFLKNFSFA